MGALFRYLVGSVVMLTVAWCLVAVQFRGEALGMHVWRWSSAAWQASAPTRAWLLDEALIQGKKFGDWAKKRAEDSVRSWLETSTVKDPTNQTVKDPSSPAASGRKTALQESRNAEGRVSQLRRATRSLRDSRGSSGTSLNAERPLTARERTLLDETLKTPLP